MNSMIFIVWILPVIFMIHDFEEIIMSKPWEIKYNDEINRTWPKRQPFANNFTNRFKTAIFSIGVGVEFIIFSVTPFL